MKTRGQWLFLVLFFMFSGSAAAQTFTAALSGANEVPPADPDGSGTAVVTLVGTTVTFSITVANITLPPDAQHIHSGVAGVNGPIVIGFPGVWVGNTLTGTTTTDAATAAAIVANPAAFYVNVHTSDFPGGAIRGQLVAAATSGIPTASTWALILLAAALGLAGIFIARNV
jgi:CHRD domain-containing protein